MRVTSSGPRWDVWTGYARRQPAAKRQHDFLTIDGKLLLDYAAVVELAPLSTEQFTQLPTIRAVLAPPMRL